MAADAFIQCRVTSETKALIRALADQQQVTESALVKRLLDMVLSSAVALGIPKSEPVDRHCRDARLYVRLDPNDRLLLRERAASRGIPTATYASALIRSHLRNLSPLPKEELLALKRSVAELGAIGRNLNQIARVANQGGRAGTIGREEVGSMLKVAGGLRDHVKALLRANERSWMSGYADTSH
ncbi:MAG: plasmid mobilization protein [Terriglobia bacterium]